MRKRKLTQKQALTIEGVAQGKSLYKAALDAGYAPTTAKVNIYKPLENTRILEAVEKRRGEALRNAQIDTAVIVGSLAEIATASLGDVLDENGEFDLEKARENGVDHLIKKLRVRTRYYSNGPGKEPDKEVTHEFEMYSRLEALNQLRDNFGMRQEPRPNSHSEVESAIQDFIRRAKEKGYNISQEEAREFIEPRMASNLTH